MSLNDERLLIERISRWPNCEKAFAFVLKTWGSSPLPAGSMLAISDSGKFEGSLSGGCVENSVIEESAEVIRSGVPKRLSYGVSDDQAWDIGLPCGGFIEILILKPNEPEFSQVLNDTTSFTLMANLTTGKIGFCTASRWFGALPRNNMLWEHAKELSKNGKSGSIVVEQIEYFVRPFTLPWHLFLVGAVHIAQLLSTIADTVGFNVTIIDPRHSYATKARFPSMNLLKKWPETALQELVLDSQSAVVTLSHDAKIDDEALTVAINSPVFYIGALGSQKNHRKRIERLKNQGLDCAELKRIRGPVGLNIGSRTSNEIAISILSEIIATRNGKTYSVTSD
jgi:xanthine dehydrogenase accessory factor